MVAGAVACPSATTKVGWECGRASWAGAGGLSAAPFGSNSWCMGVEMENPSYEELYRRASENILEVYVMPEIERRQKDSDLEVPVELFAAQVIFYPDRREPEVRINSEVRALAKVRLKSGVEKGLGDTVTEDELEGLEELVLMGDEDPDCGHATLLRLNDRWMLAFDLVYNKGLARKHLEAARQFIEAAEFSQERESWSAFVDNLFSAAELSAKATLLALMSDARFREKAAHKATHRRYNRFVHLGNADPKYAEIFNKLSRLRYPARYLERDFSVSRDEASNLLQTVRRMIDETGRVVGAA
jgi:uncharacterized protein (UPF0332 family)